MNSIVIYDFNKKSDIQGWTIVDDVVMGGKSSGSFILNDNGLGVFEGCVSLENNGGFSAVRYRFQKLEVKGFSKLIVNLRGDGKLYQFRIKANSQDYYSYIAPFSTTGEWEEIAFTLEDMWPSFRGRRLDQANFHEDFFEEITFLIGNKKEENFKLMVDNIVLK